METFKLPLWSTHSPNRSWTELLYRVPSGAGGGVVAWWSQLCCSLEITVSGAATLHTARGHHLELRGRAPRLCTGFSEVLAAAFYAPNSGLKCRVRVVCPQLSCKRVKLD